MHNTGSIGNYENCISKIMKQIFSAVNYLHGKGIAHRDIKILNLLYYRDDVENLENMKIVLGNQG